MPFCVVERWWQVGPTVAAHRLVPMLFSSDDRRVCKSLWGSQTTVTVASLAV